MTTATYSRWNRFQDSVLCLWYNFKRDKVAIASFMVLSLMTLAAVFAPLLSPVDPYDPTHINIMNSKIPPVGLDGSDPAFPLGTDTQGRDLLSIILYSTRMSLLVGLGAVALQVTLGILFGLLAGHLEGPADFILTRIADAQLSISTLVVAIIIGAAFKANLDNLMLGEIAIYILIFVIGLSEWPQIARSVRASVLTEKKKKYAGAAKIKGCHNDRPMFQHVLPDTLSPIFIIFTVQIPNTIISETTLSFLGLGMPETQPSLGSLIRSGFDQIQSGSWWTLLIPSVVLVVLMLTIHLLTNWLRNVMNPHLHKG